MNMAARLRIAALDGWCGVEVRMGTPELVDAAMSIDVVICVEMSIPRIDSTFEQGAPYLSLAGEGDQTLVDGEIIESDPPRLLKHTWRALYDPETASEPHSRVTWEIEPQEGGVTKLTVTHDQLEAAPKTAASVAGGWSYVLSGLKTLLETGEPLESA